MFSNLSYFKQYHFEIEIYVKILFPFPVKILPQINWWEYMLADQRQILKVFSQQVIRCDTSGTEITLHFFTQIFHVP